MVSDLKFALRSLRYSPGFTLVAVLIVAIGIGAATAMFSTVNALVLRPLALPEPDRLVSIYETNLPRNQPFFSVSVPNFADWKARARSWESLAAIGARAMNLTSDSEPDLVQANTVTASFFPTLGIPVLRGRNFLEAEDAPSGAPVAILSEAFWQRRFGGATDVLGRTLTLDGTPYTIVGVLGPDSAVAHSHRDRHPHGRRPGQRGTHEPRAVRVGRLKPGVSLEQADAELKDIAAQIWIEHPEMDRGWSTRLLPFSREIVGDSVREGLFVLLGAVGLLLLIACANLSNLLLVRASARAYELAIRTSLGARRGQVIRQIVTEGLVVSVLGGAAGVLVALWAVDLMRLLPLPRAAQISVDLRVLGVACVVTLVAGLLAGLPPALKASLVHPQEALKGRTPRSSQRSSLRDAMVVAQLAISLTLLVGVALLARSFSQLLRVDPGFRTDDVARGFATARGERHPVLRAADRAHRALPGVVRRRSHQRAAVDPWQHEPERLPRRTLRSFRRANPYRPTGGSWTAGTSARCASRCCAGAPSPASTPRRRARSVVISNALAQTALGRRRIPLAGSSIPEAIADS